MSLITPTNYYKIDANVVGYTLKDQDVFFALPTGIKYLSFENNNDIYQLVNFRNTLPAAFAGAPVSAFNSNTNSEVILTAAQDIVKKSDAYTGTAPTNEKFKDSIVAIWNDNSGSPGAIVAAFPYSLFEQFSTAVPVPYA